jgi:hypothetical protein
MKYYTIKIPAMASTVRHSGDFGYVTTDLQKKSRFSHICFILSLALLS